MCQVLSNGVCCLHVCMGASLRNKQWPDITILTRPISVTLCLLLSILSLTLLSPLQVYLHRPTPLPLLQLSCLQRLLLPSTLPWVRCCWPHATCLQDMATTLLQLNYTWTTQLTTPGKQWWNENASECNIFERLQDLVLAKQYQFLLF